MYLKVLMNMSVLRCENPTFRILDSLSFFFILFLHLKELCIWKHLFRK